MVNIPSKGMLEGKPEGTLDGTLDDEALRVIDGKVTGISGNSLGW